MPANITVTADLWNRANRLGHIMPFNIAATFFWFDLIKIDHNKTINTMPKIFINIKAAKPGAASQT
jgi:hypothetical protein